MEILLHRKGLAMDEFQFLMNDAPAAPVRESWDEAAHDAVSAGVAAWVWNQFPNSRAIQWTAPTGRAAIKSIPRAN
jgi:hypothetical protein